MIRLLCFSILIHLCLLYITVVQGSAAEYGLTANLRFRETYNDNVFYKGIQDFEHRITPSLAFAAVTDRAEVQAAASLDMSFYQKNDEFNTVDQYYQLLADVLPSDRLQLAVTGTYVRDQTVYAELAQTGILTDRNTRKQATLAPAATYWFTARDRLQFIYGLNDTQFSDENIRDYLSNDLRISWIHDLKNERTNLVFLIGINQTNYSDTENTPDEKLTQRTVGAVAGFDHQLSETATFRLVAGPRYTNSDFRGSDRDDEQNASLVGDAQFTWHSERTTLSMQVNQGYVPSTAGQNVNRTRVDLGLAYRLTERLGCSLSGHYRFSETDGEETTSKNQAFTVQPQMNYSLSQRMNLRLVYSYGWTENKITNNTEEQNRLILEFRWLIHKPEWKIRKPQPQVKWPWR